MFKTLIPAHGRDYKSRAAVVQDWQAGRDFLIADLSDPDDGRPTSIRDWPPGHQFNIRYARLTRIVVVRA